MHWNRARGVLVWCVASVFTALGLGSEAQPLNQSGLYRVEIDTADYSNFAPFHYSFSLYQLDSAAAATSGTQRRYEDDEPDSSMRLRIPETEKAWKLVRLSLDTEHAFLIDQPGSYRVFARRHQPQQPGAHGFGEIVKLDLQSTTASVRVEMEQGPTLKVLLNEAGTGERLKNGWCRLEAETPLPDGALRIYHELAQGGQDATFCNLPPGRYRLSAGRAIRTIDRGPWYRRLERTIEIEPGHDQELTLELERANFTAEEIDYYWPFILRGRVTDAAGKPVPGVKVNSNYAVPAGGPGTTQHAGIVATDADGRYELRFRKRSILLQLPGQTEGPRSLMGLPIVGVHVLRDGARASGSAKFTLGETFDESLDRVKGVWGEVPRVIEPLVPMIQDFVIE